MSSICAIRPSRLESGNKFTVGETVHRSLPDGDRWAVSPEREKIEKRTRDRQKESDQGRKKAGKKEKSKTKKEQRKKDRRSGQCSPFSREIPKFTHLLTGKYKSEF